MVTTFVDIDRGRLLDMAPGRSGEVVRKWIDKRPTGWTDQIQVAAIDAFAGYATAIRDRLPDATLVIDWFHAIKLGHGYRNYDNYRRRLLLGCGIQWATVPTHRIRSRQLAFAA